MSSAAKNSKKANDSTRSNITAVASSPVRLTDTATLRKRARAHVEKGPVTADFSMDPKKIIAVLNEALATELVCVLRYRRHHFMAKGVLAGPIKAEFLEHSNEELEHADSLAERIVQLGGEPDFAPDSLTKRSHAEYVEGTTIVDMIKENLVAERVAIESYREIVEYIGKHDPTSRRIVEGILAVEEEHADDLNDLLEGLPKEHTKKVHVLGA